MVELTVDDVVEAEPALDAVLGHHGFGDDHDLAGLVSKEASDNFSGCSACGKVINADEVGIVELLLAGEKLHHLGAALK